FGEAGATQGRKGSRFADAADFDIAGVESQSFRTARTGVQYSRRNPASSVSSSSGSTNVRSNSPSGSQSRAQSRIARANGRTDSTFCAIDSLRWVVGLAAGGQETSHAAIELQQELLPKNVGAQHAAPLQLFSMTFSVNVEGP